MGGAPRRQRKSPPRADEFYFGAFILPSSDLFPKSQLRKRNARSAYCPLCAPKGAHSPRRERVVTLAQTLRKESAVVTLAIRPHHSRLASLGEPSAKTISFQFLFGSSPNPSAAARRKLKGKEMVLRSGSLRVLLQKIFLIS